MMINVLYTPGLSVHACIRMIRRHIEERDMMDLETVPQVKCLRELGCLSCDTIVIFKNQNICLFRKFIGFIFGCAGSLLLCGLFSSCGE